MLFDPELDVGRWGKDAHNHNMPFKQQPMEIQRQYREIPRPLAEACGTLSNQNSGLIYIGQGNWSASEQQGSAQLHWISKLE